MSERTAENDAPARQCDRCCDNALGLGSSARCICGPNVACAWCGQGLTRAIPPGSTEATQ